jgi:hypothetical protein
MPNEVLIKVDRTSPVGNPFYMKNEFMRDEVCNKYEKHFEKSMQNDIRFIRFIRNIVQLAKTHDIALGCWCYPKRCHAETIKKFIENTLNMNS